MAQEQEQQFQRFLVFLYINRYKKNKKNKIILKTMSMRTTGMTPMEYFLKLERLLYSGACTDGVDFNPLKITKNVKFGVTPRTKIEGNFLSENNTLEDGSVLFVEDPLWKGATMAFAHILRDKDESIVTVNLSELNMLHGTFYKMEKETFHKLVSVSHDFENSLEK